LKVAIVCGLEGLLAVQLNLGACQPSDQHCRQYCIIPLQPPSTIINQRHTTLWELSIRRGAYCNVLERSEWDILDTRGCLCYAQEGVTMQSKRRITIPRSGIAMLAKCRFLTNYCLSCYCRRAHRCTDLWLHGAHRYRGLIII
jgi:hypothetical protein